MDYTYVDFTNKVSQQNNNNDNNDEETCMTIN